MDVVALEADRAAGRVGVAGDQPRQGGLARPGRADHRGQGAGPRGQRDVVQQRLVALDGPRHRAHVEPAGSGGRRGLGAPHQRAAGEHQVDVADGDHVTVAQQRGVHPGAVDEGAVDAAVVDDLRPARGRDQGGVVPRGQHVGDDDVVVGGAADRQRPRRRRSRRAPGRRIFSIEVARFECRRRPRRRRTHLGGRGVGGEPAGAAAGRGGRRRAGGGVGGSASRVVGRRWRIHRLARAAAGTGPAAGSSPSRSAAGGPPRPGAGPPRSCSAGPSGLPRFIVVPSAMSTSGTRRPCTYIPLSEPLSDGCPAAA